MSFCAPTKRQLSQISTFTKKYVINNYNASKEEVLSAVWNKTLESTNNRDQADYYRTYINNHWEEFAARKANTVIDTDSKFYNNRKPNNRSANSELSIKNEELKTAIASFSTTTTDYGNIAKNTRISEAISLLRKNNEKLSKGNNLVRFEFSEQLTNNIKEYGTDKSGTSTDNNTDTGNDRGVENDMSTAWSEFKKSRNKYDFDSRTAVISGLVSFLNKRITDPEGLVYRTRERLIKDGLLSDKQLLFVFTDNKEKPNSYGINTKLVTINVNSLSLDGSWSNSVEDFLKYADLVLLEEFTHGVVDTINERENLEDLAYKLDPKERSEIQSIHPSNMEDPLNNTHEYIRIIFQEQRENNITELVNPVVSSIRIKSIQDSVKYLMDSYDSKPMDDTVKIAGENLLNYLDDAINTEFILDNHVEWFNNNPISKYIPLRKMFNIVNSNAFATWTKNGITLYKGSDTSDIYHEAWHGFTQLYLTKDEKIALYNEVRRVKNNPNLSNLDCEEILAEEFKTYAQEQTSVTKRPVRNKIFRKILEFLKALFGLDTSLTQELFDRLYTGQLNNYTPSVTNIMFGKLNKSNLVNEEGVELNYVDSRIVRESMDYLIRISTDQLGYGLTQLKDPKIFSLVLADVRKKVSAILKESIEAEDNRAVLLNQFVYDNWNTIKKDIIANSNWNKYFKDIAIVTDSEGNVSFVSEDDVFTEENKGRDNVFDKKGNELSVDERADSVIVQMLKNIGEYQVDPESEDGYSIVYNEFGVNRIVNYHRLVNILTNTLINTESYTDMYKKLKDNLHIFPEFYEVIENLGEPIDNIPPGDTKVLNRYLTQTKFFTTFHNTNNRITTIIAAGERDTNIYPVQFNAKEKNILDKFRADFSSLIPSTNKFLEDGSINPNYFVTITPDGELAIDVDKFVESKQKGWNTAWKFDIYKLAGVNFTNPESFPDRSSWKAMEDLINSVYLNNKTSLNKIYLTNPVSQLRSGIEVNGERAMSNAKEVDGVVQEEAKYSRDISSTVITNAEGSSENEVSLVHHLNITANALNDHQKYPTYMDLISDFEENYDLKIKFDMTTNPIIRNSMVMERLFKIGPAYRNPDGTPTSDYGQRKKTKKGYVTIEIGNYNGATFNKEQAGATNEGLSTSKTDGVTKYLMDINSYFKSGIMENTRHGSKSSAFYIKINDDAKGSARSVYDRVAYIPATYHASADKESRRENLTANGTTFVIKAGDRYILNDFALDVWKRYISNEMMRINQSWKGIGDNISIYKNFKDTFTAFDSMLSERVKELIYKEMRDSKVLSESLPLDLTTPYEIYLEQQEVNRILSLPEIQEGIRDDISTYFNNVTLDTIDMLGEHTNKIPSIPVGFTEDTTYLTILNFEMNSFIHKMDIGALFYGDPASFNHKKEEYHKRNTAFSATGDYMRHDSANISAIRSLGRAYADKLEKELNTRFQTMQGNTFNTAIFKDNIVESSDIDTIVDRFAVQYPLLESGLADTIRQYLKDDTNPFTGDKADQFIKLVNDTGAYFNMTEADAQGFITFDAYRILRLSIGDWTDTLEDMYHRIVNEETVDDIKEFFKPLKAQYSGPLRTEALNMNAFHKFSLVPLIPSVIKGTNMEDIHNNMVKQNIDYALFESGSKMGSIQKDGEFNNFYKEGRRTVASDEVYTKNPIFFKYLKIQVKTEDKFKNEVTFSSQLRKLIDLLLFKDGELKEGRGDLADRYVDLINKITDFKSDRLLDKLGIEKNEDGYTIKDYTKVMKEIRRQLKAQQLPDNAIDFLDVNQDGSLKTALDSSIYVKKIDNLIMNLINNNLINQKFNGEALIQLANTGFENKDFSNENVGISNDLPFYKVKDGKIQAMKVKVAMSPKFRSLLNLTYQNEGVDTKVGNIETLNRLLKDENWLSINNHRSMITMFGVRIPVQGPNSMELMEVYEFLPEEQGSVIILPSEIVAKSGGDFDIDKLTIIMPNITEVLGTVYDYLPQRKELFESSIKEELDNLYSAKRKLENSIDKRSFFTTQDYEKYKSIYDNYYDTIRDLENEMKVYDLQLKGKIHEDKKQELLDEIADLQDNIDIAAENLNSELKDFFKEIKDSDIYKQVLNEFRYTNEDYISITKQIASLYKALRDINNPLREMENELLGIYKDIFSFEDNYTDILKPNTVADTKPISDNYAVKFRNMYYNPKKSHLTGLEFKGKGVSPTKVYEMGYNIHKHEQNKLGKEGLGILAVNSTFKSQLNRAKAYYIGTLPILFKHNTVTIDGKDYPSLHHTKDANGEYDISDINSQLMNGTVDVEKDAWIAYLNLNPDAIPVYTLLLNMGVPFKDITSFIVRPVITEYLKELQFVRSPFNTSYTQKDVLFKFLKESNIKEYLSKFKSNLIKGKASVSTTKEVLSYFILLKQEAESMRKVSSALNMDTRRNKTPFEAYIKKMRIHEAILEGVLPQSVILKMAENSIIKGFSEAVSLGIDLSEKILPLRNNKSTSNFLWLKTKALRKESADAEKFATKMKDDILLSLIQKAIAEIPGTFDDTKIPQMILLGREYNLHGKIMDMVNKYPELREKYLITNSIVKSYSRKSNNYQNIHLLSGVLKKENVEPLYNEMRELIDEDVMKVESPEDNKELSDLFKQFAYAGLMQSGVSNSPIYFSNIIPQDFYSDIVSNTLKTRRISEHGLEMLFNTFRRGNPYMFKEKVAPLKVEYYRYRNLVKADEELRNVIDTDTIEDREINNSKISWARKADNSYEVSSKGDKRFSALYAKLKDGRTIEEAYQLDIKGYRQQSNDWKEGKGKAPIVPFYSGNITPNSDTIFVFGSNPEGRHGAGAAKIAKDKFGAIYGQGEGLQGNAYALPTKDLRIKENNGYKYILPNQIIQSIKKLYEVAKQNPTKKFKIAYKNTTEKSLNGYTGLEMIEMFNNAGERPLNIVFSKEWIDTKKINPISKEQSWIEYKALWEKYLDENPDLKQDLIEKSKGKVLTDMFASTDVSQARALAEILNEDIENLPDINTDKCQ